MNTTTEKNKNNKAVLYLLAGLLTLSVAANIILLNKNAATNELLTDRQGEVDSLTDFKKSLENQFEAMTFELGQFKGKNIELDSLLELANKDISQQKLKIERLIKENKDLPLLQRQLAEMKSIRDQYRVQIEELIKENKELRFANVNLTQEVDQLSRTTRDLNEKVELASVLKAENIDVKTFREKGKGKLEPSDKAKRVSRITTVCVIAENKVAKPGKREVVLRVIKPDGYVLTDPNNGSGTFTKDDGRSTDFTLRRSIQYTNERAEIIFDWDQLEDLKTGLYISEMYVDGRLMGNYKFNLK